MFRFVPANISRSYCGIAASILACLVCASADAQPSASIPNFAPDNSTGWVPARGEGDEFLPPPSGPGPVQAEPGHAYIPNRGGQPTYRIADLNNPILKPSGRGAD